MSQRGNSTPLPIKVFSNPVEYGLSLTDTGILGHFIVLAYEGSHTYGEIIDELLQNKSDEPLSEFRIRQIVKRMEDDQIFKIVTQNDGTIKLIYPDLI